jgi:hypothetical protein
MSSNRVRRKLAAMLAAAIGCGIGTGAVGQTVTVTIENLAPSNGGLLTPFWVGFHDGTFDIYDSAAPASSELERLAEDGNAGPLSAAFVAGGGGATDATVAPGGPFAPGDSTSMNFVLDGSQPESRYFSYAAMVIPSNDAFIANGDPQAHMIFDGAGNFLGADFIVLGTEVLDAGTEVNDEVPANTAAFGQSVPDTGVTENGVVGLHAGLMAAGSGGILDDAPFANADFTADGYQVARITITPEPGAAALLGTGALILLRKRQRS